MSTLGRLIGRLWSPRGDDPGHHAEVAARARDRELRRARTDAITTGLDEAAVAAHQAIAISRRQRFQPTLLERFTGSPPEGQG